MASKIKKKTALFPDQLNYLVKIHSNTTNTTVVENESLAQADATMDHQLETADISFKHGVIEPQKKIIDYGALLPKQKHYENSEEIDKCLVFVRLNLEEASGNPGVRKVFWLRENPNTKRFWMFER